MTKFAAKIRSAARWYVESWQHVDPAAAVGMFGTGMVAVPMTLAPSEANAGR